MDVYAAEHGRPDLLLGHGIANPRGMVVDQILLEVLDLLIIEDDLGEFTDSRVDTVHDLTRLDLFFEHGAAFFDLF